MTNGLRQIADVTFGDVAQAIEDVLAASPDTSRLLDFLASIDWSSHGLADAAIAGLLGELEGWSTEYAEGDLTLDALRARLESARLAAKDAPAR